MTETVREKESFDSLFTEQPDLARMLWALRRAKGFALYFARCNVPAYRAKLIEAIRAHLARPIILVEIKPLAETETRLQSVDGYVEQHLMDAPAEAVVFITGLENLLPSRNEAQMLATTQELNWRRGAFQKMSRPMVFWLPEYALTVLARNAPDLYDWYSGVYDLEIPQQMRADVARATLDTIRQTEDRRWMDKDERDRWEDVLRELLAATHQPGNELTNKSKEIATEQSSLLNQLGKLYYEQARYPLAKDYFERALKIDEEAFGSEHPNVARDINHLGLVFRELGKFPMAQNFFERALHIHEESFGPNTSNIAPILNNLARTLQDLGELVEARPLLERALKIDEEIFGSEDINVARDANNLANLLKDLGKLQDARRFFERALHIYEKNFGSEHPYVSTSTNNLALLLKDLGELDGAGRLFEHALKIDEKLFGSEHPTIARDLNNLASVFQKRGEFAEARQLFERALNINEKAFGLDHPNIPVIINNLAGLLQDSGELKEARELFNRSLNICRKFLGDDHPKTKMIERNLDVLLKRIAKSKG